LIFKLSSKASLVSAETNYYCSC